MVAVTRTFTVTTAPHTVAAYLRDFANAEQWDPGTQRCYQTSEGAVAVGTQWHNESKLFGISTELTYRLVTDTEQHIVFEGKNKTATSTDDITLRPAGSGTEIEYVATIEFNGAAKLAGPILKAGFEAKVAPDTVEKMTAALEAL